jgi:hypothetical protein
VHAKQIVAVATAAHTHTPDLSGTQHPHTYIQTGEYKREKLIAAAGGGTSSASRSHSRVVSQGSHEQELPETGFGKDHLVCVQNYLRSASCGGAARY